MKRCVSCKVFQGICKIGNVYLLLWFFEQLKVLDIRDTHSRVVMKSHLQKIMPMIQMHLFLIFYFVCLSV